ncbi:MAG: hypothetical protein ABIH86_00925 [Planctomycetota bacterium]
MNSSTSLAGRLSSRSAVALVAVLTATAIATSAESKNEAALQCVADTYISCYPVGDRGAKLKDSEQGANAGTTPTLKIKRNENQPIFLFDFKPVPKGATITEATLVVFSANNRPLNHIGYCSLHVDWAEGEGKWNDCEPPETKPNLKHKGACYIGPKGLDSRWREYESSDFSHAVTGNGGNATGVSLAKKTGDRFEISIDPYVAMAMMNDGQTLVIQDETGIFEGDLGNAFIISREGSKTKRPTLNVKWTDDKDATAPAFDGEVSTRPGLASGSIIIDLPRAGDDGVAGVALGYNVSIEGKPVTRVLIPRPARRHRAMLVNDLTPGATVAIIVEAFDEAGNIARIETTGKTQQAFVTKLEAPVKTGARVSSPKGKAQFSAFLADGLTMADPLTGEPIPGQMRSEWNSKKSLSLINAVRGEIVGLQVMIKANKAGQTLDGIRIQTTGFEPDKKTADAGGTAIPASAVEFFRAHFSKDGDQYMPDGLLELKTDETLSLPSQPGLDKQVLASVYIDIIIPKDIAPGTYSGDIIVERGKKEKMSLPLTLAVYDVVLPDRLSFVVEMNAYGTGDVNQYHAIHRLCHKHRLSYNVVPYSHTRPTDEKTNPELTGAGKDMRVSNWERFDRFYGPVLSGDLFKDLPRAGEPASHMYLPFHDSWPASLEATSQQPELWKGRVVPKQDDKGFTAWVNKLALSMPKVEDCFSPVWRDSNLSVAAAFKSHFEEKNWNKTQFQVFNNHKYYFSSGSLSLWTMDEPQYGKDFRALNFIYSIVYDAMKSPTINLTMRSDVSRPEWQGDRLDDAVGLSVISGSLDTHQRLINHRMETTGEELWWYGGSGKPSEDPASLPVLFFDKWSQRADGGMPVYTTFAGTNSWDATDSLRVVRFDDKNMPVATFRMKAYRRGQQDIELMNILASLDGFNRQHVATLVGELISTTKTLVRTNPDDPGSFKYEGLDEAKLRDVRERLIATIVKNQEKK